MQNKLFKKLWLYFITHTSKINASNIFFLPLKLSGQNFFGQQDEKQKVTSHSHQQKNPRRNSILMKPYPWELLEFFSKQVCF
jgi:hypothetical protein